MSIMIRITYSNTLYHWIDMETRYFLVYYSVSGSYIISAYDAKHVLTSLLYL